MNRAELVELINKKLLLSGFIAAPGGVGVVANQVAAAMWPVLRDVWNEAYVAGWRQRDGQGVTSNPYGDEPA